MKYLKWPALEVWGVERESMVFRNLSSKVNVYHSLLVQSLIVCGRPRNVRQGQPSPDRYRGSVKDPERNILLILLILHLRDPKLAFGWSMGHPKGGIWSCFLDSPNGSLRHLISFYNNCSYLVGGHIFSLAETCLHLDF